MTRPTTNTEHCVHRSTTAFKSLKHFSILFIIFLFFSSAAIGQLANVTNPTGGFRIEGDLKANTPTVGEGDWIPGPAGGGYYVLNANGTAINTSTSGLVTDAYNSTQDRIFTNGSKFNDYISVLTWGSGTAPNKNDINNAMYHISSGPSISGTGTDQWVFIGGDRLSTSGTSYIDFEFLQGTVSRVGTTSGTFSGSGTAGGRTVGDLLLSMEYTGGGSTATVYFYQWQLNSSSGVYDFEPFYPASNAAFARTNSTTVDVSFGAFGSTTYQPYAFVEAAVDITAVMKAISPCAGINVKNLWIKTKASASPTAALKDFVDPIPVSFSFGNASISYGGPYCQVGTATATLGTGSVTGGTYSSTAGLVFTDGNSLTPNTGSSSGTIDLANSKAGPYTVTYTYNSGNGCIKTTTASVTIIAAPDAPSLNPTQPTCTTSTGSISVTSATTGLTFSLNSTNPADFTNTTGVFNNLSPSTTPYVIRAKNSNGCISSGAQATINPAPVTPDTTALSITQPTCTTSTGTISVTSSTSGLTFSINSTNPADFTNTTGIFNNLASSTTPYVIRAKNSSGCISNGAQGTINPAPATPDTPALKVTQPTCTTSTGSISVTSAITGLTFSINSTNPADFTNTTGIFSSLAPGTTPYVIRARNSSGCISNTASATINQAPTVPGAPTADVTQPSCTVAQGTITVTSATTGLTFSLNSTTPADFTNTTGVFNVGAGSYTLRSMNSSGCISDGLPLTVNAQPATPDRPVITIQEATLCGNLSQPTITVNCPVNGYTYTLTQGTTTSQIIYNGSNSTVFTAIAGKGFSVTATTPQASGGCTSVATDCNNYTTNQCPPPPTVRTSSTVQEMTDQNKVTAAPNPFNDQIRFTIVSAEKGKGVLELYNFLGQKMATVFQGNVEKGQVISVPYNVPMAQRHNLIFIYRTGTQKQSGKLINLR